MDEKHTPGTPWSVDYNTSNERYPYLIVPSAGDFVGRVAREDHARLIAAAPTMLGALQTAEWRMRSLLALLPAGIGPSSWGDLDYTDARFETERDITIVVAAIASATGQEGGA